MIKNKGFGLLGVIIIIVVTSIISGLTTGVIMLNNNELDVESITNDKELKQFIEVYEVLLSKYYDDIDKEAMLNAAEEGMLNFLGDKYTTYLEDNEYQDIVSELSSTYTGVGIEINGNVIYSVVPSSPAANAGLEAGDIITKVNGIVINDITGNQISSLIKEDKSDTVTIEVKRGEDILSFNLKKEVLANKTINYNVLENTTIGYIYIKNFSENLDEQMENALTDLESKGITSLIIDLRENSGGYLQAAQKTAELFLEKGAKIYSLESSNSGTVTYRDETDEKRDYPVAILINNNSASASEILAAALKESYNASLVGTKSYGKGKVQEVIRLENGDSVKTTSAKWLTPNGVCIDGLGLMPDYEEPYILTGIYNDSQLQKAVDILS